MLDPQSTNLNEKLIKNICRVFDTPDWLLNLPSTLKKFSPPEPVVKAIDDFLFAVIGRPIAAVVGVIGLFIFFVVDFAWYAYKGKSLGQYFTIPD